MTSLRIIVLVSALAIAAVGAALAGDQKLTNWRVQISIELQKPATTDSLITPHNPSVQEARKKVEALVSKLKNKLRNDAPARFFNNPPYAGDFVLTVVLRQAVSMRVPIPGAETRAEDVVRSESKTRRMPTESDETRRRKEVELMAGRAREFEIEGMRIVVRNLKDKEVFNAWCPAHMGKLDIKKYTPQLVNAIRQVAASPETPVFQDRR